jgi:hypothetical protein
MINMAQVAGSGTGPASVAVRTTSRPSAIWRPSVSKLARRRKSVVSTPNSLRSLLSVNAVMKPIS